MFNIDVTLFIKDFQDTMEFLILIHNKFDSIT